MSIILDGFDVTTSYIVLAMEDLKQQLSETSHSEYYDTMSDGTRGSEKEKVQLK